MFDVLKIFDKFFVLEMFKEFKYVVAGVTLFVTADVIEAALREKVVEGDGGGELPMLFDFDDSAEDIVFELDVHLGIVLIGDVEERGVEGH